MEFDYERLREDLLRFFEGAYFVAGFGAAIVDREMVKEADDEELVSIALQKGFRLEDYVKSQTKKK